VKAERTDLCARKGEVIDKTVTDNLVFKESEIEDIGLVYCEM